MNTAASPKDKNGVPIREDVSWTKRNISEVTNWMSQLHWIFGSQANITVELVSVEAFNRKRQSCPSSTNGTQTLDNYKSYINGNADDTVILTGTVYGGWGYSTPLDPGKPWVSFVSDNVTGMPATSSVNKFILLIAHEISHAIMNDKKGRRRHALLSEWHPAVAVVRDHHHWRRASAAARQSGRECR